MEQIRTVKPGWHISENRERWRRNRHDARLPILRRLLAALAVDREANRALGALDVDICSAYAARLPGTTADVAQEHDQRAELGPVFAERRDGSLGQVTDLGLGERVEILAPLRRLEPASCRRVTPSTDACTDAVR